MESARRRLWAPDLGQSYKAGGFIANRDVDYKIQKIHNSGFFIQDTW